MVSHAPCQDAIASEADDTMMLYRSSLSGLSHLGKKHKATNRDNLYKGTKQGNKLDIAIC